MTTILNILNKPGLVPWALKLVTGYLERHQIIPKASDYYKLYKLALAERDEAGEKGTIVHKKIEKFLAGNSVEYTDDSEINNALDAFYSWYGENNVELIDTECIVYSPMYKYAGTFDALVRINDKVYLIDFKTSKSIYDTYIMQVVAYKQALEELGGYFKKEGDEYVFIKFRDKIDKTGILRLDKKEGYPIFRDITEEEQVLAQRKFNLLSRYYWLTRKTE